MTMQVVAASCNKCNGLVQRFENPHTDSTYYCTQCGAFYIYQDSNPNPNPNPNPPTQAAASASTPWFVEMARFMANGRINWSR